MRTRLESVIALLLIFSIAGPPMVPAAAAVTTPRIPPRAPATILFTSEAVAAPLFSPLRPLYRRAKVATAQLYVEWAPAAAAIVTTLLPWLPLLPALWDNPSAGIGLAILAPRLERMQKEFKLIHPNHDIWESISLFIQKYFGGTPSVSRDTMEEEQIRLEHERINREFLRWLAEDRTTVHMWDVPADILEIQLRILAYPSLRRDLRAAFENLKEHGAKSELYAIALNSRLDYTSMAAAIDALATLHAEVELHDIRASAKVARMRPNIYLRSAPLYADRPDPALGEVAFIPETLPILARLEISGIAQFFQHTGVLQAVQRRLHLQSEKSAEIVLRLLTLQDISRRQALHLLNALVEDNDRKVALNGDTAHHGPKPEDVNIYAMVSMLAVLQLFRDSKAVRSTLNDEQIERLKREITHIHWNAPEHDLNRSSTVSKLAGKLGELVHQGHPDPAVRIFLGFLFEMVFRQYLQLNRAGPFPHPAIKDFDVAKFRSDAQQAARTQFSILGQLSARGQFRELPWAQVYRYAMWYLWNRKEWSLSLLARDIALDFFRPDQINRHYQFLSARPSQEDLITGQWMIWLAEGMEPTNEAALGALFTAPESPLWQMSEAALRQLWYTQYLPAMYSSHHYDLAKTEAFVRELPNIDRLIHNQAPLRPIPPYRVALDPTHVCNNECEFCRFELREVPIIEKSLKGADMERLAEEGYLLNPVISFRTSGTIGEPGLNKGTIGYIHKLNELGIHHGFTTNGLRQSMPEDLLRALVDRNVTTDWVSISIDAGSDEVYDALKHPKGKKNRDKPFQQVLETMRRLQARRLETGAPTKLFASFLVQEKNYHEIGKLIPLIKQAGFDGFQIKFQHYDPNRSMQPEHIQDVFSHRSDFEQFQDDHFKVIFVQDEQTAQLKNVGRQVEGVHIKDLRRGKSIRLTEQPTLSMIAPHIHHCIIQFLFPSIAATGMWHPCCQNYTPKHQQRPGTLPIIGDAVAQGYQPLLEKQLERWNQDVQAHCLECAPQDNFFNEIVGIFIAAARFKGLFDEFAVSLRERQRFEERLSREPLWQSLPDDIDEGDDGTGGTLAVAPIANVRDYAAGWLGNRGWLGMAAIVRVSLNLFAAFVESFITPIPGALSTWQSWHRPQDRPFAHAYRPMFPWLTIFGLAGGMWLDHLFPAMDSRWIIGGSIYFTHLFAHATLNLRAGSPKTRLIRQAA